MLNKWETMLLFASKLIPLKNFAIYIRIIIWIIERTVYISKLNLREFYFFFNEKD